MVFKKIIFQKRYVELESPPFMEKSILNFHFDYLTISLKQGNRQGDHCFEEMLFCKTITAFRKQAGVGGGIGG